MSEKKHEKKSYRAATPFTPNIHTHTYAYGHARTRTADVIAQISENYEIVDKIIDLHAHIIRTRC